MTTVSFLQTKIGEIEIRERNSAIVQIKFGRHLSDDCIFEETPLLMNTTRQLTEYLNGERKKFDLPLAPEGTPFQKSVWEALCSIPYGETRSYSEIAKIIGNPLACRAVGMANHRNPIAILIPCHRVIGANGSLTGYAGGLEIKQFLLQLEKEHQ